jgi:regulator of sirC expression with transglutaminase-like and TPR domain
VWCKNECEVSLTSTQTSTQDRLLQDESSKVVETKRLLKSLSAKAKSWTYRCQEHSSAMSDLARALQVSTYTYYWMFICLIVGMFAQDGQ